jgi:uncharacterized protein YbjT (DUF2867 family)
MRSDPAVRPVLVAGATGFVGRAVLRELFAAGLPVVALARSPQQASTRSGLVSVRGDVRDPAVLEACFAFRPWAVVQLVGLRIHVEASEAVLRAARRHGVERYVHVSALGARASAISYHHRKWRAEEHVRASGLACTILRPSVIFGEGCDFLRSLLALVRLHGVTPMVGSGRTRLQPLCVRDMAAVVRRCLEDGSTAGVCYDLGGPEVVTLDEIVSCIERQLGRRKPRLHVPLGLARVLASPLARPLQGLLLSGLDASVHPERR